MRLRGAKLLARRYKKPETIKGIVTPPAFREDGTRSLWEVVETTQATNEKLGMKLEEDWILVTSPNSGIFLYEEEGTLVFVLAASSILRVIPWTSKERPRLTKGKLLVRRSLEEKTESGIEVVREETKDDVLYDGEVIEVGELKEEIEVGNVVYFTAYTGVRVDVGGEKMLVIDERSVLMREERS